jgi:hypothetical protein
MRGQQIFLSLIDAVKPRAHKSARALASASSASAARSFMVHVAVLQFLCGPLAALAYALQRCCVHGYQ